MNRMRSWGWSLSGAQWLQPVAIGGKWPATKIRANKRKLPPAATSCLRRSMVRRGSTVRVRQRALQKSRKAGLFFRSKRRVFLSVACMESVVENPGFGAFPTPAFAGACSTGCATRLTCTAQRYCATRAVQRSRRRQEAPVGQRPSNELDLERRRYRV